MDTVSLLAQIEQLKEKNKTMTVRLKKLQIGSYPKVGCLVKTAHLLVMVIAMEAMAREIICVKLQ